MALRTKHNATHDLNPTCKPEDFRLIGYTYDSGGSKTARQAHSKEELHL